MDPVFAWGGGNAGNPVVAAPDDGCMSVPLRHHEKQP